MTIKEQIRRIIKAAPHLPFATFYGIIFLLVIPIILFQIFNSITTHWTKTIGIPVNHKEVQDRLRDGQVEYFYSIGYKYIADGKENIAFQDEGFRDKSMAERQLNDRLAYPTNIEIWYDSSDPRRVVFTEEISWIVLIGGLLILTLPILYIRWLLLKYYELEIEE